MHQYQLLPFHKVSISDTLLYVLLPAPCLPPYVQPHCLFKSLLHILVNREGHFKGVYGDQTSYKSLYQACIFWKWYSYKMTYNTCTTHPIDRNYQYLSTAPYFRCWFSKLILTPAPLFSLVSYSPVQWWSSDVMISTLEMDSINANCKVGKLRLLNLKLLNNLWQFTIN